MGIQQEWGNHPLPPPRLWGCSRNGESTRYLPLVSLVWTAFGRRAEPALYDREKNGGVYKRSRPLAWHCGSATLPGERRRVGVETSLS